VQPLFPQAAGCKTPVFGARQVPGACLVLPVSARTGGTACTWQYSSTLGAQGLGVVGGGMVGVLTAIACA
jgi:hypothetical protein